MLPFRCSHPSLLRPQRDRFGRKGRPDHFAPLLSRTVRPGRRSRGRGHSCRRRGRSSSSTRRGYRSEALVRLCHEYFELADLLTVLFFTPGVYQEDSFAESASNDDSVTDAIERGHSDGSIDPDMGSDWVQNLLWSLLYTSMDYVNRGSGTRLQALDLTVRSLRRGIAPDPSV